MKVETRWRGEALAAKRFVPVAPSAPGVLDKEKRT
jgi:hypothetical protein